MIEHHIDEDATPKATGANGTPQQPGDAPAPYTPYQPALDAGISEEWDRKNARRLDLIERELDDRLTLEEKAELEELQHSFFAYIETIFPRQRHILSGRLN